VGPRDLAEGLVTVARRDTGEKASVALGSAAQSIPALLDEIQAGLLATRLAKREERSFEVDSLEEAIDAGKVGFAKMPWAKLGPQGEDALNAQAISVRCLQRPDGSLPASSGEADLVAVVARSY
jgi:prolyl-tRNA synthetase